MSKAIRQQDKSMLRGLWVEQLRVLSPVIVILYLPAVIMLGIIKLQNIIPVRSLTRDPSVIAGKPFYIGAISNIGILFWCSAVTICWLGFVVLRQLHKNREFQRFLLSSGGFTFVLMIDDFFLIHEEVFPRYLNIPEEIVLGAYGGMLLLYLFKSIKTILKTDYILLVLALGFFGGSVVADNIPVLDKFMGMDAQLLVEDGLKFLGIISWFAYFARVGTEQLKLVFLTEGQNKQSSRVAQLENIVS
ncbi:MAG: hypothetical protein ICV85_00615 [Tolypothrix sp. T3-bin4]|nr:hypothetical protein [Tolypothrix sp. T3-bin4]